MSLEQTLCLHPLLSRGWLGLACCSISHCKCPTRYSACLLPVLSSATSQVLYSCARASLTHHSACVRTLYVCESTLSREELEKVRSLDHRTYVLWQDMDMLYEERQSILDSCAGMSSEAAMASVAHVDETLSEWVENLVSVNYSPGCALNCCALYMWAGIYT